MAKGWTTVEKVVDSRQEGRIFSDLKIQKYSVAHPVLYSIDTVWIKNQLDVTFCILYFFSNSCLTCFGQPWPIIRSWRLRDFIASCWYVPWLQGGCQDRLAGSASMDALPANRSWQPSCSHGTYQHEVITSRSRQLLMMGTWLPETCWATIRREIKNTKVTSSCFFLSTLNFDARSTTHLGILTS